MPNPTVVLLVRFRSSLSFREIMQVVEDRASQFQALAGLQQKHYLQDPASGEYAGLYLWESPDALAEFQESELRASIAEVYQMDGKPRVEVYRVVKTLRDGQADGAPTL